MLFLFLGLVAGVNILRVLLAEKSPPYMLPLCLYSKTNYLRNSFVSVKLSVIETMIMLLFEISILTEMVVCILMPLSNMVVFGC